MSEFSKIAAENKSHNVVSEIFHFMSVRKKWWLLPIIVVLMAFGVLVLLSSTAAAPFIYTLF